MKPSFRNLFMKKLVDQDHPTTSQLHQQPQEAAARAPPAYVDKTPSHYEEDRLISLELGGNPRDPKNLWLEMWGTLAHPLTARGPFRRSSSGPRPKMRSRTHFTPRARSPSRQRRPSIAIDWFKYYKEKILGSRIGAPSRRAEQRP